MSELRPLPWTTDDGRPCYAVTEPGGFLDTMANVAALETATVWHALAQAMTEGPQLSADEANFVLARLVEVLGDVLPIAVRAVAPKADAYGEAARDIGAALRDMRP
jgi:hypothetical protein